MIDALMHEAVTGLLALVIGILGWLFKQAKNELDDNGKRVDAIKECVDGFKLEIERDFLRKNDADKQFDEIKAKLDDIYRLLIEK
jgi:hypothetical protein